MKQALGPTMEYGIGWAYRSAKGTIEDCRWKIFYFFYKPVALLIIHPTMSKH